MGSWSNLLGDRRKKLASFRRRVSSLICGSSSSRATAQMEDYPVRLLVNSAGNPRARGTDAAIRSAGEIRFSGPKSAEQSLSDRTNIASSNGGQPLRDVDYTMNTGNFSGPSSGMVGHSDVQPEVVDSSSAAARAVPRSIISSRSRGDHSAFTMDLGYLMSNRMQRSTEGNVLHIDITRVRSADLTGMGNERSSQEPRRNNSALLNRTPSFLFATDDDDIIAYRQSLLHGNGSNNLNGSRSENLWRLDRMSRLGDEQRLHSGSELRGRLRSSSARQRDRGIACPSGIHTNGPCLCGLEHESAGQNSMPRILVLAEALFEALSELHFQPQSYGPFFSNPAPESTVDSLPVKAYEKSTAAQSGDDMDQCYICLEEYETGHKIRVLPCAHEYHMDCVDKWLKEIHGVCPVCRREV